MAEGEWNNSRITFRNGHVQHFLSGALICESVAPYEEGGKPRHTDYDALKEALHRLHTWMVFNDKETVGLPDHIDCGLAGGNRVGVVPNMAWLTAVSYVF